MGAKVLLLQQWWWIQQAHFQGSSAVVLSSRVQASTYSPEARGLVSLLSRVGFRCGYSQKRPDFLGPNSCSYCVGKGMVLEDSVWESAWETAQTRSPLRVEDDDALDKIDPDVPKRPEGRVYGPRPEAVRKWIGRTLKELERRTGALSKRAKHQHRIPMIHSRMAAAIKANIVLLTSRFELLSQF